jgi:4-hydroxy-2-oxoheptanedioate aldolase
MRKNLVKDKIRNGKPAVGIGLLWDSPDLVEFCGYLGFNWIWLDGEHGRFNSYNLWDTIRASEVGGIIPIIRAPTNDPKLFLNYFEAGMMGVIVPHVNTREDMATAVKAVKYPPLGERSSGAMRPARYALSDHRKDYFQRANEETMVIALIEEPEGIDNLDEILKVDGLDAVVIGYGDLSMNLGYPGEKEHPEVQKLGRRAREKIVNSDKWLQETVQDPVEARKGRRNTFQ